jgi:hypothetical protein
LGWRYLFGANIWSLGRLSIFNSVISCFGSLELLENQITSAIVWIVILCRFLSAHKSPSPSQTFSSPLFKHQPRPNFFFFHQLHQPSALFFSVTTAQDTMSADWERDGNGIPTTPPSGPNGSGYENGDRDRDRDRDRGDRDRDRDRDWEGGRDSRRSQSPRSRSPRRDRSPRRYDHNPSPSNVSDDRTSREAENSGSNLFVSGIAPRLDDAELRELFGKYGRVEGVNIMLDPHTKESRGFGFVQMSSGEEADAAKDALTGEERYGRVLSVEKARRSRASKFPLPFLPFFFH